MIKKYWILAVAFSATVPSLFAQINTKQPFVWEAAHMYHAMTDRFANGDNSNDSNYNRTNANKSYSFQGGDLRGIIKKIDQDYFKNLGINVLSFTPLVEQIHGGVSSSNGLTYGFEGNWTKDWTAIDRNFGTKTDLQELIDKAHAKGMRVVMDVVLNHVGPKTELDSMWPNDWVRTSPHCTFTNYQNTVSCVLENGLQDIKTTSDVEVPLPEFLVDKWKSEDRYDTEIKSLNDFFTRTGYPRAPKFYIIKWLTDYVHKYGFDGFNALNANNVDEAVWGHFKAQCNHAFSQWKTNNPSKVLNQDDFYLSGSIDRYGISNLKLYDFGDKKVNYYDYGFNSLSNNDFEKDAKNGQENLYSEYSTFLSSELEYYTVINSVPRVQSRLNTKIFYDNATTLLLAPGISKINYGDETGVFSKNSDGSPNVNSTMNWDDVEKNAETKKLLEHWQKLGQFRNKHPAVGAGIHKKIRQAPYVFSRGYDDGNTIDRVIIALNVNKGFKDIPIASIFKTGTKLRDAYSGIVVEVRRDRVQFESDFTIVLLEQM